MENMLNRRQCLIGSAGFVSALLLSGCAGGAASAQGSADRIYLTEEEIDELFSNPNSFKGKWVKLPGKALGASENSGEEIGVQAYYDIEEYDRTYIARSMTAGPIADGDYILVDGMIDGAFEGETQIGIKVTLPLIVDATITESSYMELVAPALSTIEPAVSVAQNEVVFTCDKVEYAEAETRVYLTVNNPTPFAVSFGSYSICLIQNGKQVNLSNSAVGQYEDPEHYPELSYEVQAGVASSGVVVFPPIQEGAPFQIRIPDIASDDYSIEFIDVTLDIPAE